MREEARIRAELVEAGRRLYAKGMVASNDGNLSARLPDGTILVTPSGVCKGDLRTGELLRVDRDGRVLSGTLRPTSEMKMHLAVYRRREDVRAVVHAHPPVATAFAVAGLPLDRVSLPETVFSLGPVVLVPYGTPSTQAVPDGVGQEITGTDTLLLSNHGALTAGTSVMDAYFKMETLEHFAVISFHARLLGGERFLDSAEVDRLFGIRTRLFGRPDPREQGGHLSNGG